MSATKNNQKPVDEVGIIGQMYEERKPNKSGVQRVGVLESREKKFKTLMMRDREGKTFNITYATFKSNWRKYQGEEVIQTSTQIEEKKAEEKKEVAEAKKEVKKEKVAKPTAEERVKEVRALRRLVEESAKSSTVELDTRVLSKGGIIIKAKGKKRTLVEVWVPSSLPDVYSFRMREDVDKYIETDVKREYLPKDVACVRYRPKREDFESFMSVIVSAIEKFVEDTGFLNKDKNEKTEEKENE